MIAFLFSVFYLNKWQTQAEYRQSQLMLIFKIMIHFLLLHGEHLTGFHNGDKVDVDFCNCCVFRPANVCSHNVYWSKSFFYCAFLSFFFLIFPLVMEKYEKNCINSKQMILTSERRAKHLFAGRNTQHATYFLTDF